MGAPHFFSRSTARPRGPSVTLTARASCFTPRRIASRASWSNMIRLAAISSPFLSDHGKDFALVHNQVILPLQLDLASGVAAEEDLVALFHLESLHFAALED